MELYRQLEQDFARFAGTEYAVAVSSGTAGLHLALAALGVKPGKRVAIPELTHISNAFGVSYLGGDIVPYDVGQEPEKDVDATIITHLYGRPSRLRANYATTIEDCSEAHGAPVGKTGIMSVYSLYRNKIVHAEEGGMICTNDKNLYKDLQALKSFDDEGHTFYNHRLSYNYRMPNTMALIALASLRLVKDHLAKRAQIAEWYEQELDLPQLPRTDDMVWWVYDVLVESEEKREWIVKAVSESRRFFKPVSMMPMYNREYKDLVAYDLSRRGVYFPITPIMTHDQVKDICFRAKNALSL